jgi:heptosyltransferase-2
LERVPPEAFRKASPTPILVLAFGRIGDVVRTLSAVRMIAARHPGRAIDVVCRAPADEILRFAPEIRSVIVERTPHGRLGWSEKRRFIRQMRSGGYGRAYVFSRGFKAALTPFLAGIKERFGYFGEGRLGLINRMRWDEKRWPHKAQQLCAVALEPGEAMPAALPPPRLVVDAGYAEWCAREGIVPGQRVVALAPGASFAPRRWPLDHFIALARRVHDAGCAVWVIGSPDEQPYAEAIAAAVPIRDFTPSPLAEAAYQLRAASAFVCNESGLSHIAAAIGTPTLVLYGPTAPDDCGPINPEIVHIEPPDLAPGPARPIAAIGVAQVEAALLKRLGAAHPPR